MKSDFNPEEDIAKAKRAVREAKLAKKKAKEAELGIFETNNPCDYCSQSEDNISCRICQEFGNFSGKRMRVMTKRKIANAT